MVAENHYKPWSEEEDEMIIDNQHLKAKEIAELVVRTTHSIQNRHKLLVKKGLAHPTRRPFTKEEDFYIKMTGDTLQFISKKLGRDLKSVGARRKLLGIAKRYKK